MTPYHAGTPMERVHLDFMRPLPKTKKSNEYVLMAILPGLLISFGLPLSLEYCGELRACQEKTSAYLSNNSLHQVKTKIIHFPPVLSDF
jgi:hypothetical protein